MVLACRGIVSHLQIVNKEWVVVHLYDKPNSASFNSNEDYAQPKFVTVNPSLTHWFHIGSIDSFERSVRRIEEELQIAPSNQVPIIYTSKTT